MDTKYTKYICSSNFSVADKTIKSYGPSDIQSMDNSSNQSENRSNDIDRTPKPRIYRKARSSSVSHIGYYQKDNHNRITAWTNRFRGKMPPAEHGNGIRGMLQMTKIANFPVNELTDESSIIRINVSGQNFAVRLHVLNNHPDTLLGNPRKRRRYYDSKRMEYFFDRHRPSFEPIFHYYLYGGRLRRPNQIPDEIFLKELLFYELEDHVIAEYKRVEGYTEDVIVLPDNKILKEIWKLFEYPETSPAAFCVALISVAMTLMAILILCIETLPAYDNPDCTKKKTPNWSGEFFIMETICNLWFTIELIIRAVSCPSQRFFWRDFKNTVDVVAILPYYVTLISMLASQSCESRFNSSLSFLRVIRLVRIFKLTKHSIGLQVLILTFRASVEGLGMFLVALTVSMLVYSSAIYYAEHNIRESHIQSIPDAFWWAIITMTTVGYGDKVPVGPVGKLIGAACAISGILTLAIPVPIIAGHFNRFYSHKTGRARLQITTA